MLYKQAPEKFWNRIAKKYAAEPIADRAAYETKIARLKNYLTPDMSVLDIGCATGTQCGDIAGSVHRVTGIDISSNLLAVAEQRMADRHIDNVTFLQTSAFDTSLAAGSFDVVMAFHVLHFFDDTNAIVERIHALLKPGGLFISETGCLGDRGKLLPTGLSILCSIGLLPGISMLTDRQLQAVIAGAGFSLVEKTRFSNQSDAEFTYLTRKIQ